MRFRLAERCSSTCATLACVTDFDFVIGKRFRVTVQHSVQLQRNRLDFTIFSAPTSFQWVECALWRAFQLKFRLNLNVHEKWISIRLGPTEDQAHCESTVSRVCRYIWMESSFSFLFPGNWGNLLYLHGKIISIFDLWLAGWPLSFTQNKFTVATDVGSQRWNSFNLFLTQPTKTATRDQTWTGISRDSQLKVDGNEGNYGKRAVN